MYGGYYNIPFWLKGPTPLEKVTPGTEGRYDFLVPEYDPELDQLVQALHGLDYTDDQKHWVDILDKIFDKTYRRTVWTTSTITAQERESNN